MTAFAPGLSVARSVFVLACVLAAHKGVGTAVLWARQHFGAAPTPTAVCQAPVAVDTPYGPRLGCADAPALAACQAAAGDRLSLRGGRCRRIPHGMPVAWSLALGRRLNVNRAEVAQLQTLPDIGRRTAQAIVRHRVAHGPYASVEALAAVAGVGPQRAAQLRRFVTTTDAG